MRKQKKVIKREVRNLKVGKIVKIEEMSPVAVNVNGKTKSDDEDGVVYFRRQEDGLHAIVGEFPAHCRAVVMQRRMDGGTWGPRLGTTASIPVKRVKEILYSMGPFRWDEFRFLPFTVAEDDDPKKAEKRIERIARLKNLPHAPREKKESELVRLIRIGGIVPPLQVFAEFHKRKLAAMIEANGTVTLSNGGGSFTSLSEAGAKAKEAVCGTALATNGWSFWLRKEGKKMLPLPRVKTETGRGN